MNTSDSQLVEISTGLISGTADENNDQIRIFRGIPFAEPPVGDLRWKPPQSAKPWEGVKECTQNGNACPQKILEGPFAQDFGEQNEDCLHLNIWTPATSTQDKLPVMVWIYGGGFFQGSNANETYDAVKLAEKGAVVVTINYRIGLFGFLAHPWLSEESEHGISGNYGFLDQIHALKWVKENTSSFGGDPEKVTIFGESAGGRSVCFLMVSPLTKGLFQRAIVQSGSLYRNVPHLKKAHQGFPSMEEEGAKLVEKTGCQSLSDLRNLNQEQLLAAANTTTSPLLASPLTPWKNPGNDYICGPIVDDYALTEDHMERFERGEYNNVPLIIGWNNDEAMLFFKTFPDKPEIFQKMIRVPYPHSYETISRFYPVSDSVSLIEVINRFMTDAVWMAPADQMAAVHVHSQPKTFLYLFSKIRTSVPALEFLKAFHGAEIRYVFGNLGEGQHQPDEADKKLMETMMQYWVNFAESGDPNGNGLPQWPVYDERDQLLELGAEIKVISHPSRELCEIFMKNVKK